MTNDSDSNGSLHRLAHGFRGRTLTTAKLIGKAGFKALGRTMGSASSKPVDAEKAVRSAAALAGQMNQLKGLMMKFGQMASYLDGALPPAAQQVLSQLQQDSTPMTFEAVGAVIESELGAPAESIFDEIDREPFAAASIGQVHRARAAGRELAVKVQYPGIEAALQSDLKTLGVLGRLSTAFMPMSGKALITELRERMREECDYLNESRNQLLFQRLFRDMPGVYVPSPVPELTTRRVFSSELIEGQTFYPFRDSAEQPTQDRAGERIFEVVFRSVFEFCVFNADPHPGNYLFRDDDVVFLDYGCVKYFSADFVDRWKAVALAVINGDRPAFERAFPEIGMVARPKHFDWDYQWGAMQYLYKPVLQRQPFTYTHDYVKHSYGLLIWDNPNKHRMDMPADWLLLNRLQWGLNSVLAHLGATGNWPELWRGAVESPTRTVARPPESAR